MHKSISLFAALLFAAGVLFTACDGRERKPAVRFAVISDTHFGHAKAGENVSRSLKVLFGKEPLVDALFVVGDLTNNGRIEQYEEFVSVFSDKSLVPEGVALYFMLGNNHDRTCEDGKDFFIEKTGQPLRHYVDIRGYPFIAFSEGGSGANPFNEDARQWLAETMADAAKKYPGKPVFAFSHVPPLNTCYGSSTGNWGTDIFRPVYDLYPQAIVFGGHSHFPIGDPRSIHQETFTTVNDGSLYYSGVAKGELDEGIHPPRNHEVLEGLIVNVMPDGTVEIERWDTFRDEEILPRWVVEAPHDGSRFTYKDRDGLPAPAFATGAVPTGKWDGDAYEVTIPQASDNEVVFKYYIDFLGEDGGTVYSCDLFSLFYLNSDMPEQLTRRVTGLPPGKTLTLQVTAADSYGNRSEPLTGETFTVPAESF